MEETKSVTKKMRPKKDPQEVARKIKGQEKVYHDLFRLDVATTRKDIGWTANEIWEPVPHKHFFHTYDSSGKKMHRSTPTAAHFHHVTVKEVNGEFVAECGPPMVLNKGREYPYKNDNHTHDVEYLGSEVVEVRTMNTEAVKVINQKMQEEKELMRNPMA